MKNILIVSGHTDLNNSVANKNILNRLKEKLPNAEFDLLSELYPNYRIDIEKEQNKLLKADIIVLQYPVFWYSMPSLLERWMEEVFKHGFSHGSTGDKLKGKKIIVSLTTGAPEEAYSKEGRMGHEIEDFLNPIKVTCKECQMELLGVIKTYGVSYQIRNEKRDEIINKTNTHVEQLLNLVNKEEE